MTFHDDGYTVETSVRRLETLSGRTRASFDVSGSRRTRLLPRGAYRGWTLPDGVSKVRDFWPLISRPNVGY